MAAQGPTIWFWVDGGGAPPPTSFIWQRVFPLITWLAQFTFIV